MFLFVRVDRSYCAFFTPTQITTSLFRSEKNVFLQLQGSTFRMTPNATFNKTFAQICIAFRYSNRDSILTMPRVQLKNAVTHRTVVAPSAFTNLT